MRWLLSNLILWLLLMTVGADEAFAVDQDPPPAFPNSRARYYTAETANVQRREVSPVITSPHALAAYARQPIPEPDIEPAAEQDEKKPSRVKSKAGDQETEAEDKEDNSGKKNGPKKPRFDASVVSAGQAAFDRSCTSCHDAEKSYSKTKSLSGWRACVKRMAGKSGADISSSDVEPISVYLTSRNANAQSASGDADAKDGDEPKSASDAAADASPVTIYGTFSPTWRGGNDNLENPGFFPDAWLGANWQTASPISAKITACVTCHESQEAHRIELVEASMKYDLTKMFGECNLRKQKASIEAGRFVVPFGAFAAQSNPGVYRTVSKPLIYDMGQRVRFRDIGDPVLPMPYSDQGANFNYSTELFCEQTLGFDAYVVNGLQGTTNGLNFYTSRAYNDNNALPAGGTRVTFGDQRMKFGGSVMSGQASPTGGIGGIPENLYYRISGFDATFRHEDRLRIQFEYARRDDDVVVNNGNAVRAREHIAGYYIEGEYQFAPEKKISFLARYDWQHRDSPLAPIGSVFNISSFGVARFTYGFNFTLANGSLLMINHEHWMLPNGLEKTDVLGLRWACTF